MLNKILIRNVNVLDVDEKEGCFKGDIKIEGNKIIEIGNKVESESWKPDKIINADNMVVLPGLINCHTHSAMTLLRSYADDLPLMQWLEKKIWPIEANLKKEDVYWGAMLGILEMIKSGTTCFADMYFFMEKVASAVKDSGIRANLCRGLIASNNGEKALDESTEFIKNWNGEADGRITTYLGPHAPYTCPPEFLKKVVSKAEELNVGIHIHVAETKQEIEEIQNKYNKTPVKYLSDLGVFKNHTIAAHCVHLTNDDIEILTKEEVGIVHNPESNMKLASGIAPIPELLEKNVVIGIGTDGAASNNNLDMIEEMHTTALLHKVNTFDPTVVNSNQTLTMATKNGARVLGLDKKIGQIKEGMHADLILLDINKAHFKPLHNIEANLVYSASAADVDTVIIDGNLIMENREMLTLDEEKIYSEVNKTIEKLLM